MSIKYGILSQNSVGSTLSNFGENGWKFTVGATDIKISGFRVKVPNSESVTCKLWDVAASSLIGTATVTSVSGTWTEVYLASAVILTSGHSYLVTAISTAIYYYGSATSTTSFNSKISYVTGVHRRPPTSAMPAATETNYMYPHVDIIIAQNAHVTNGSAIYTFTDIHATNVTASAITWEEDVPDDTSIGVSISTDGVSYTQVESGDPVINVGGEVETVYVKIEMSTNDVSITPSLSSLYIMIQDMVDTYSIILNMVPKKRFCSSAGQISIAYNAEIGNLAGIGGPVDNFNVTFSPEDLIPKPHQNPQEHLEITNITADGDLIRIYYTNTKCDEHLEIANITAVGALTNIDDI